MPKLFNDYTPAEQQAVINYLCKKELKEYWNILNMDNALTVQNIKRIFESPLIYSLYAPNFGTDAIKYDDINWETIINSIMSGSIKGFNMYQSGKYGVIHFSFDKSGILVSCPEISSASLSRIQNEVANGRINCDEILSTLSPKQAPTPSEERLEALERKVAQLTEKIEEMERQERTKARHSYGFGL